MRLHMSDMPWLRDKAHKLNKAALSCGSPRESGLGRSAPPGADGEARTITWVNPAQQSSYQHVHAALVLL